MEVDPAVLHTLLHGTNSALGAAWHYASALYAELPAASETEKDYAASTQKISRTLDLISDFQSRVTLETEALEITLGPVDLEPLLQDLVETVATEYEGWSLECARDRALPKVRADTARLSRLLEIMVHNAVGYSEAADQKIVMDIQARAEDQSVVIAVWNAVPLIPPEYLSAVFEPMPQLPQGSGWPKWGLGLKLYLGRAWARAMGGDLRLELAASASGQPATRLALTLPQA
jgi:signal transduction histidine kinase